MTIHASEGPAEFFADHPAARLASLAGAGTAVGVFAGRAARSRGLSRMGWIALCALEVLVFVGILSLRTDVRNSGDRSPSRRIARNRDT